MTAMLIQFPELPPPDEGNGALAIVRDYLARVHAGRVMARVVCTDIEPAMSDEDYFLGWLWEQGFKIVPLEQGDCDDGD